MDNVNDGHEFCLRGSCSRACLDRHDGVDCLALIVLLKADVLSTIYGAAHVRIHDLPRLLKPQKQKEFLC